MIIVSPKNIDGLKSTDLITLKCEYCGELFEREKRIISSNINRGGTGPKYCSRQCYYDAIKNYNTLVCEDCGKEFKKSQIVNGKKVQLKNRKQCLECLPYGYYNLTQAEKISIDGGRKCAKCKRIKDPSEFYKGTVKKHYRSQSYCKDCYNINSYGIGYNRGVERKLKLVEMLGGECSKCGYKKNYSVLCFHHTDPSKKKFGLTTNKIKSISMKECIEEAAKCILLCSNCHTEKHHPDHLIDIRC